MYQLISICSCSGGDFFPGCGPDNCFVFVVCLPNGLLLLTALWWGERYSFSLSLSLYSFLSPSLYLTHIFIYTQTYMYACMLFTRIHVYLCDIRNALSLSGKYINFLIFFSPDENNYPQGSHLARLGCFSLARERIWYSSPSPKWGQRLGLRSCFVYLRSAVDGVSSSIMISCEGGFPFIYFFFIIVS